MPDATPIQRTLQNHFEIVYLSDEHDWATLFKNFLGNIWETGISLQHVEVKKEIRETKLCRTADGFSFIAKRTFRKTSFSLHRAISESLRKGTELVTLVEHARNRGFEFPARIYLIAEKREYGILRDRWVFTEFIRSKNLKSFLGREREIAERVSLCHAYGLSWGGDPHPGNFLFDESGKLRGIDFSHKKASTRAKARDWKKLATFNVIRAQNFSE